MKLEDFGALVLLGALWGVSFLFIRVAVPALGPLVLADLRVLIAGGVLVAAAVVRRRRPALGGGWRRYALLGALNSAVPFALTGFAALRLPASMLATLNASIPLFTAVVAAVWLGERLTGRKAAGLLLGVAGVAVLVGWSPLRIGGGVVLALGCSLVASCCYAAGAVYARRAFAGVAPFDLAIGQLVAAGAVFLLPAVATAPRELPSARVTAALLALALLSTAAAYLLYFRLNERVGPTKTNSVAFLIPGFGLLSGVIFLDEPFGLGTMVGLGVVLASVVLVTGAQFGDAARGRRRLGTAESST